MRGSFGVWAAVFHVAEFKEIGTFGVNSAAVPVSGDDFVFLKVGGKSLRVMHLKGETKVRVIL